MIRRLLVVLGVAAGLVALVGAGVAAADPSSTNAGALDVCNFAAETPQSTHSVNLIHVPDGSYGPGHFDGQITPGECARAVLGWPHTGGFEVPGGYSIAVYNHANPPRTIGGLQPAFNHSSPFFFFFDNPNETYHVHMCQWDGPNICNFV